MKTWLVTGCSTGIGRGIAAAALKAGDRVIVTARNTDKVIDLVSQYPETAVALRLDLTDCGSMEKAVKDGIQRFGGIDVLVNNAGYGYRATIEESEDAAVRKMFETNVFGPGYLMGLVLPEMRKNESGIIVNVSSIGGVRATPDNGYYSATKAALEMISEAAAKETSRMGIRVVIVEPGAFRTHFYDALTEPRDKIASYDHVVGSMRLENKEISHDQPGDPARAGKLIVKLVNDDFIPERLPLGSDAVKVIRTELERRLSELDEVEKYSIQTDFQE